MDKKKVILLVGALIVAIGTAFLARSMFAGASAPQAEAAAEVAGLTEASTGEWSQT